MIFRTKPSEIRVYKVGSPEGRQALATHMNAFESKNLWDCWEIRTPSDEIALVTKDDWIAINSQDQLYPISPQELVEDYDLMDAPTHCLRCGKPTGYQGIAALPLRNESPFCQDCKNS